MENYDIRTIAFSVLSVLVAIGLTVFYIVIYAITKSLWCGATAFYHIMLILLRGYVLVSYRKRTKNIVLSDEDRMLGAIKQYRNCGIVFIALTLCLIAMIIQIVRADKVFNYDMYVTYTIAAFTMFQIVVAIVNYIKSHKTDNYTVRSLRSINLTTALVSFISLQAIALDTFSHNANIPVGNAVTGFVVCGLVVASGIYMIVHSLIRIFALKNSARTEEKK
ncbi:MAG: hypothetical protein IJX76_07165 [Clostridia bacterium]|nr:hypothetical protein [Clostridia bacterium]